MGRPRTGLDWVLWESSPQLDTYFTLRGPGRVAHVSYARVSRETCFAPDKAPAAASTLEGGAWAAPADASTAPGPGALPLAVALVLANRATLSLTT